MSSGARVSSLFGMLYALKLSDQKASAVPIYFGMGYVFNHNSREVIRGELGELLSLIIPWLKLKGRWLECDAVEVFKISDNGLSCALREYDMYNAISLEGHDEPDPHCIETLHYMIAMMRDLEFAAKNPIAD